MCADGHCTSGVVLTTGVPGSGKTLLVRKFAERIGGRAFDARRSRNAMLVLAVVMRDSARQTLDIDEAKAAVVSAGHDGEAVDAGIESGALILLHGDVSFGIPSFHRHMIDLLRQREQERAPATRCHGS